MLTRQGVPVLPGSDDDERAAQGAYVLDVVGPGEAPEVVLVGTGSEVALCCDAAALLADQGRRVQVVSMPSWDRFALQGDDYQSAVIPPELPALAVEAGSSFGWDRWADDTVAIDRFGASAPGDVVFRELGFTPEHVAARAEALLEALTPTN